MRACVCGGCVYVPRAAGKGEGGRGKLNVGQCVYIISPPPKEERIHPSGTAAAPSLPRGQAGTASPALKRLEVQLDRLDQQSEGPAAGVMLRRRSARGAQARGDGRVSSTSAPGPAKGPRGTDGAAISVGARARKGSGGRRSPVWSRRQRPGRTSHGRGETTEWRPTAPPGGASPDALFERVQLVLGTNRSIRHSECVQLRPTFR